MCDINGIVTVEQISHNFSSISIVDFEQINVGWVTHLTL